MGMKEKLYSLIARRLIAMNNCAEKNDQEWLRRHREVIEEVTKSFMPSGSGVDIGTKFDSQSRPDRLVFNAPYHHMNQDGMYDGWTRHQIIVTPSLAFGFDLRITGRNRNDIKDYYSQIYHAALEKTIEASGSGDAVTWKEVE